MKGSEAIIGKPLDTTTPVAEYYLADTSVSAITPLAGTTLSNAQLRTGNGMTVMTFTRKMQVDVPHAKVCVTVTRALGSRATARIYTRLFPLLCRLPTFLTSLLQNVSNTGSTLVIWAYGKSSTFAQHDRETGCGQVYINFATGDSKVR